MGNLVFLDWIFKVFSTKLSNTTFSTLYILCQPFNVIFILGIFDDSFNLPLIIGEDLH